jgi:cysteine synthase
MVESRRVGQGARRAAHGRRRRKRAGAHAGKTIIDSSSGNTGIALALIGAARGYDVHLVMPANVSAERKALVKAYGATLIESDPLEGSDGAIEAGAQNRRGSAARYFYTNQYNNPANWQAHYATTGPEIWRQTAAASRILWPGWARPAPSWVRGAISRSATPTSSWSPCSRKMSWR